MKNMRSFIRDRAYILVLAVVVLGSALSVSANDDLDPFVGTIEKIDAKAKMVYVKSKNGVVKAFKWTTKSIPHGVKSAALWTEHEAHVGAHVVIRAVTIAGEDTIRGLHWFGHGIAEVSEATVHFVAKDGKKIAVIAENGVKTTYNVSAHAVVHAGKTVGHGAVTVGKYVGNKGTAVVHTIEKDGKKFVHFIRHDL